LHLFPQNFSLPNWSEGVITSFFPKELTFHGGEHKHERPNTPEFYASKTRIENSIEFKVNCIEKALFSSSFFGFAFVVYHA
jgi:hypothetical protein